MRTLAALCGLLALAGCFSSGSFEKRYAESDHKTLAAAGVKTLRVENVAGRVRVEATNANTVEVDATKRATSLDALKQIHIDIKIDGDTIAVVSTNDGVVSNANVDFTIKAPASLALNVTNTAGTTRATGFTNDVSVSSQAGTIDVDMAKLGGAQRIDLSGTAGTVSLTMPRHSDATVDAHSTVGSLHSDFPELTSSRTNVVGESGRGTIGSGSAKVTLNATTGTIDVNAR